MNQKRWLAATDPQAMLGFLGKRASDRKLRLFACACVRRAWHLVKNRRLKQALPLLEGFASGTLKDRDRARARTLCDQVLGVSGVGAAQQCLAGELWRASKKVLDCRDQGFHNWGDLAASAVPHAAGEYEAEWFALQKAERKKQAPLIREIFGNPFRTVMVEPAWLTGDVRAMAAGVVKDQAFDRLPILADALQDAGCDTDDFLSHLRDPDATHVRGCWALDLVLGKE